MADNLNSSLGMAEALVVGVSNLFVFISFAGSILWVFMLIDAVKRNFEKKDEKFVWLIVLIFGGSIGAIIYLLMVKLKGGFGNIQTQTQNTIPKNPDNNLGSFSEDKNNNLSSFSKNPDSSLNNDSKGSIYHPPKIG